MHMITTIASLAMLFLSQSTSSIRDFTDRDYDAILARDSRTLFYSFSPGMPLSIEGLNEARAAATDLRAAVIFLADPSANAADIQTLVSSGGILEQIRYQKSRALRDAGIQLHYPSMLVADKRRLAGAAIPGFKSRTGYVTLVTDLLRLAWKETFQVTAVDYEFMRLNYFFKPVYGTDFIVSGWSPTSHLLNLRTRKSHNIGPGIGGDAGASVDGEFVTLMGGSLRWFAVKDILAGNSRVLLHDPGLRTYQSMGMLQGTSTHRVLGAVSSSARPTGIIFRDYQSGHDSSGTSTITPLTPWQPVCNGKNIALPMISKTGLYLSGVHDGTLRVFRIGKEGKECDQTWDSGVAAGKADFSEDDSALVYVSRTESGDTVFLADLKNNHVKTIYYGGGHQLVFPSFMTQDRVILYDPTSSQLLLLDRTRQIQ